MPRPTWKLFFVLLLLATPVLADWPQWRGPGRDGVSSDSPPLLDAIPEQGLEPVWFNQEVIAKGRGEGWSSPVVASDRVYYFSHARQQGKKDAREEYVACLDASTGKEIWHNTRDSQKTNFPQSGTPAIVNDRLYLLGAGLTARCLDAKTGDDVWTRKLPGEASEHCWQSSVAIADDVVVMFATRLFGLDAKSGEVLWQGDDKATEGVHGSPTVFKAGEETLVIAPVGGGEVVCVQPKAGQERWRVKCEAGNSSPVVLGDRLLTLGGSRKGGLRCYQISANSVAELWKYQAITDPGSSPVVVGEHVYVQGGHRLACVALANGKPAWTTEIERKDPRYTSLVAADGKVIFALEGLLVLAADAKEYRPLSDLLFDRQGRLATEETHRQLLGLADFPVSSEGEKDADKKWRQQVGEAGPVSCTSPALSDGRLYVRLKQGLACYDLRR